MDWNDDFVTDIVNEESTPGDKSYAFEVESILRYNFGLVLVNQLKNLRIKRAAIEAIKEFDVELVQDYLELTGAPWTTWTGDKYSGVPTEDMVRHFLAHKLSKIIKNRKVIEYHLDNNFVVFYNGVHITIIYSVAKIICGGETNGL